MASRQQTQDNGEATASSAATSDVPAGDDYELVYVINPELHKDADPKPAPGRVSRAWLNAHADKGWVESDPNGQPIKES